MKEIWKPLTNYKGLYEVSNFGRIKSINKTRPVFNKTTIKIPEKIVKGYVNPTTGYKGFNIKNKYLLIHREVAKAFIPNKSNKPEVNHKDGNKLNNCVDNLEWVTSSENNKHKFKVLGYKQKPRNCKPIVCLETNIKYPSIIEASRKTGISRRNIQFCLNNITKTAGGYTWKFIKENYG